MEYIGQGSGAWKPAVSAGGGSSKRWDPSLRGSALIGLAGLLAAIVFAWHSFRSTVPEAPSCISYQQTSCLLKFDGDRDYQGPPCAPVDCAFSTQELGCPFPAGGTFTRRPKADPAAQCQDPFLEATRRSLLPPCSEACCDGGVTGSFQPGDTGLPGSQTWQPRSANCSFFPYSSSEVLHHLQASKARIVVMGDSMMKQLHSRLVHMFRGSSRVIDYTMYASARYSLCRAADSFAVAEGGYQKNVRGVKPPAVLEGVPAFFGASPAAPGCAAGDPVVAIDSMFSAWYTWQVTHLKAYREAMPAGEKLILVTAVNFLEKGGEVGQEWMQYLESIRNEVKVILVSTPTGRTKNEDALKRLRGRNKAMKEWAEGLPEVSFVDFDAMTRDPHRPPGGEHDIHWMCWLRWAPQEGGGAHALAVPGQANNVLRERQGGQAVAGIHSTSDGQCRDEMDLNVWQVIFNCFMKS